MRYSFQIKPISDFIASAAEVLTHLAEQRKPMIITQNGKAKAVLQDIASFEETQETLALLKILALGHREVAAGKIKPVTDVVARLHAKLNMTKMTTKELPPPAQWAAIPLPHNATDIVVRCVVWKGTVLSSLIQRKAA